MKMLIIFVILTILNVVIQTVKSIATIKCGKTIASLVNALAYGLYTYVIFFTSSDGINLHAKALITALANLIGVYVVKLCEEKARKDKLWKVECTVPAGWHLKVLHTMNEEITTIPYNYIDIGKYYIFNFYCETQTQSKALKDYFATTNVPIKYFVSESKTL